MDTSVIVFLIVFLVGAVIINAIIYGGITATYLVDIRPKPTPATSEVAETLGTSHRSPVDRAA